jgi:arylsulfatase
LQRLRHATSGVLLLAAILAACRGGDAEDASSVAPSLIVITVDTLRADRLGAYGHGAARTPVVDALARRGVRFQHATTPFPRTTPALASMLTGLLPWRHGSREVGQPMSAAIATVPAILAARGYTTLAVNVNGAAGPAQNLHLGFARFLDHRSFADHTAAGVTDAAIALLDEHASGAAPAARGDAPRRDPIFLWVHYIDPHFPYLPPASWTDQPEAAICRDLVERSATDLVATAHVRMDLDGAASRALHDCAALYDAEIAFTDFHLGRLLDALRERGWLDGAYVVFTSDHGENLGEDGLFYEHGPSVHDASLRVPLIVAGPRVGSRIDTGLARLEDLAPTLLSLAGVAPEQWPAFDGVDLSPRLFRSGGDANEDTSSVTGTEDRDGARRRVPSRARTRSDGPRAAVAESGAALLPQSFRYLSSGRPGDLQCVNGARFSLCVEPRGEPRLYDHVADPFLERDVSREHPEVRDALAAVRQQWAPGAARERTLRTERWKLVETPMPAGGWSAALYDLDADPSETRDVAAERPQLVERMRAELAAAFADAPAPVAHELEPRELEALRALGYVR